MTTWRRTGRLRIAGLFTGMLAVLAMVIVGCSTVTDGSSVADTEDAPVYRASVSSSIEVSSSKSAARESERQSSVTAQAVVASCRTLADTSTIAVQAVNDYVAAFNTNSDTKSKAGPAIDALNRSADEVSRSLSEPLSDALEGAMNRWVDSARQLSGIISRTGGTDEFNNGVAQVNDAKKAALTQCDAES